MEAEEPIKEELRSLQEKLEEEQSFEEAVSSIQSLLPYLSPKSYLGLRDLLYDTICRVATVLEARYTARGFWFAGLRLFEQAEGLVSESWQKTHLENCILRVRSYLKGERRKPQASSTRQQGHSNQSLASGHISEMEEEQNLQLYSRKHPRDDFSSYPPQSRTAPWFVLFPQVRGDKFQTFFSLSSQEYFVKSISQLQRNRAWPTPQGWIVVLDTRSRECRLLNPISLHEVNLPPLKHKIPSQSTRFTISSSPNGPNCIILCNDEDALLFCRPRDNQWTRHRHDLYHNIREDDLLRDVTSFNGGFFGLTRSNFVAIECYPSHSRIKILGEINAERRGTLYFEEYLVACRGELYLVRLYQLQHISVSKRDSNKGEWVSVHDIDGCVIFLDLNDGFCASRSASELSLVGDCIYYVNRGETCFYCVDMKEGSIMSKLPYRHLPEGSWSRSMWVLPPL